MLEHSLLNKNILSGWNLPSNLQKIHVWCQKTVPTRKKRMLEHSLLNKNTPSSWNLPPILQDIHFQESPESKKLFLQKVRRLEPLLNRNTITPIYAYLQSFKRSFPRVFGFQKAVPTKKKGKRTLETFSEKTIHTCPNPGSITFVFNCKGIKKPLL